MNVYLIFILVALIAGYLVSAHARRLNIRALSPKLPAEFRGVYDAAKYATSQRYARDGARVQQLRETTDVAVLIMVILLGWFNVLDVYVRSLDYGPIMTGLVFFAIVALLGDLITLPFELYSTFVLEDRYGFNRRTMGLFIKDKLKSYALGALIGGSILAGVLWFLGSFGTWAWLWAWGFVTLAILAIHYIAPTWIMPLFNKFTPLEDGELKDTLQSLADQERFALSGIYVMDGSKRSSKSNAFFTGLGKKRRIALFDTLIENLSTREIAAVLAHEIGHYKKRHITKMLLIGIVKTGIIFFLISLFLDDKALFSAFGVQQTSTYAGLLFFMLLYSTLALLPQAAFNKLTRKYEFEADRFAAQATGEPEALVDALKRLSMDNLSNLTPHPLFVALNYSHPPVLERIKALRTLQST